MKEIDRHARAVTAAHHWPFVGLPASEGVPGYVEPMVDTVQDAALYPTGNAVYDGSTTTTSASWIDGTADWNTPADWSTGKVPDNSSTSVTLGKSGTYTVTISSAETFTVGSITISNPGATLSLDNARGAGLGATLVDDGDFSNSGALLVDTNYSYDNYTEGGSSLTVTGTLANASSVQIGDTSQGINAATAITLGALVNGSGASFALYGSRGYAATLAFSTGGAGFTANGGYFGLTWAGALTLGSSFTNTGDFQLHQHSAVTVDGSYSNSGMLNIDTNYSYDNYTEGGSSLTVTGTLANASSVQIGDTSQGINAATAITLGALVNGSGASFALYGSRGYAATLAFSTGGAGFTANGGYFGLTWAGALTLGSSFTNTGDFQLHQHSAVTVDGSYSNSGTLNIDTNYSYDNYTEGGSSLTVTGTLANTSSVQIGDTSQGINAATAITLGALVNGSGASFALYGSRGYAATLAFSTGGAGFTANGGYFGLTWAGALTLGSSFTNTGDFQLHQHSAVTVDGSYSNSGTLNIDTNYSYDNYTEGGSSLTVTGTLANTSSVQIGDTSQGINAATAITLGALVNGSGASFALYGSRGYAATLAFSTGGAGFTANGGYFGLTWAGALTLGSSFTNTGDFQLHQHSAVTVDGSYSNSGTLNIDTNYSYDNYTEGGSSLTVTGTLANTSSVQIGDTSQGINAATAITLGALVNGSGASFALYGSRGYAATLAFSTGGAGFTANGGYFGLTWAGALTLGSSFTNTGDFQLHQHSAVTVDGSYSNSGTLNIDTNYSYDNYTEGGSSLTVTGTLANTSSVQIGDTSQGINAATAITLGALVNGSGASFALYGSRGYAATLAFSTGGAGFTANGGYFGLTWAGALTLGSSFTNTGDFELHQHSAVTVDGSYSNSGMLNIDTNYSYDNYTEGGSSLTVTGTLANASSVQIGDTSQGINAATTATVRALANYATGTISLYGSSHYLASLNVSQSATNAGTIIIGGHALLAASGLLENSGTIVVSNSATIDISGSIENSGSINMSAGSILSIAPGGTFTQTGGVTTLSGSLVASNIAVDGGVLAIDSSFDATGTLQVANGGTIDFSNGAFTNLANGTLTGGTYVIDAGGTLQLPDNSGIFTLDADMSLSGTASVVESSITGGPEQQIDSTLYDIATGGTLSLSSGRNYLTSQSMTVSGLLQLAGITFQAPATTVSNGTVSGFGTVKSAVADSGVVAASGGKLVIAGALTGTGSLTAATGATLDLTKGRALTESISGHGTLQLDGTALYTLAAGANVAIANTAVDTGATLSGTGTLGGAVTVKGTLAVNDGNLLVDGALDGSGGVIVAAGDVLDLAGGGSFAGAISGVGTLQLDGTNPLVLQSGATLSIAHLVVDAGAALGLNSGGSLSGNDGPGTLLLGGTTPYTLGPGAALTVGTLQIDPGASLDGAGLLQAALTDDGSLTVAGGTLIVAGAVSGTGALSAATGAVLDLKSGGTLTQAISGAGMLQLDTGTYSVSSGTVTIGVVTVDAGAALVGNGTVSSAVTDNGTVTASGGTLVLSGVIGGSGILQASAGATLDLTQGSALTQAIGGTGTLQLDGGTYTLSGQDLAVAAVLLDTGAALSGYGTVGGALTDNGGLSADGGTLSVLGALTETGPVTIAANATLDLFDGGSLAGSFSGTGTLQLDGSAATTLTATTLSAAAVRIDAGGTLSTIGTNTIAGAVTDAGALEASSGSLSVSRVVSGGGTLLAAAGAVLHLKGGGALGEALLGSGTLLLNGAYSFAGNTQFTVANLTIAVDGSLSATGTIASNVNAAGTLTASTGTLVLTGPAGGNGTFQASNGAVMDLKTSGILPKALTGAGTIKLDGANYTYRTAASSTVATLAVDSGVHLSEVGSIASTMIDNGSINASGGTLVLSGALSGTGRLSAAASAVLDLTAGGALAQVVSGAGTLELGGTYTLGTAEPTIAALQIDTAGALSAAGTISGVVTNNGTITVSSGTLAFLAAAALSGTGTLEIGSAGSLALLAGSSAGQTVDFHNSGGVLDLSQPSTFLGTIADFGGSDTIDLIDTASNGSTYTPGTSGGVLTVTEGGNKVATLNFEGNYTSSSFSLTSDGHGGTSITFL